MKILKNKENNLSGSVKTFSDRFDFRIKKWKNMYTDAKNAIATLDNENIIVEVDFSPFNINDLESRIKTATEIYLKTSKKGKVLFIVPKIDDFNIELILKKYGVENYIEINLTNEKSDEEKNQEYISKVSQIAKGKMGETYGKIYEISNPESMYENLLYHIQNGILTLNYVSPSLNYNINYSEIMINKILPIITEGTSINWFNANYPEMIEYWNNNYKDAINNMNNAYHSVKVGKQRKVLIECAAQHPLIDGLYPGEEFSARLNKTIELYKKRKSLGDDVKIYIPGSQHLIYINQNNKNVLYEDKISLSLSGSNYLKLNGIPAEDIYSDKVNREIAGNDGIYNTGDEAYITSEIFKRGNFNDLISVSSPGQMYRALNFFATQGVLPIIYTAPTESSYHNVINEITNAIPNQLTKAPTWRKGSGFILDDQIYINSRNPFNRRNDIIGKVQRSTKYALPSENEINQNEK